ncbi:arabinan endo-1,5-alpha-L-arabinosidase [Clostridium sp. 19966]|uniref:arabinan endo-1,5-alpha-L-arabinosidase n=1 Tax=Clostridium sp. 19966 TaxID=2768166 RepID=UPI0028DE463C|nr:arabinan endo-1,5-alpha-L-arabinosidase [Clostridium sp. 19966]MDT8719147.1 arabinan endo-1,5-alpha-L-arabinosidase [Clostridium sp. 19966]
MIKKKLVIALSILFSLSLLGCDSKVDKEGGLSKLKLSDNIPKEKLMDESIIDDSSKWGTLNTHDPSIFKDGDTYYVFSTDARIGGSVAPGIEVRKSKDMINWQYVGQALKGVPAEAEEWTGAQGLWAPDVTKIGEYYYLYYAASSFGKNTSYIGLERSKSIEGPWEDMGCVVKTEEGDNMNAIDPNIVFDDEGSLWLSYGSFWTGIYILKLDKNTGKPEDKEDKGKNIASRSSSVSGAVEGPYIIYNDKQKKYYLFESYDSLAKDYNVRVGRADKIDGPYVDIEGNDLTDTTIDPNKVGNKILGGYKFADTVGWMAPGHNSVLKDGEDYYIFHHARVENEVNWFYLNVRKIVWSEDGWPMVSTERYAGEKEEKIDKALVPGKWDVIILKKDDNGIISSKEYDLKKNGRVNGGTWELSGDNSLTIKLSDKKEDTYKCKILPAWDYENNRRTIVFTGINKNGLAIWGKMKK